MGFDLVLVEQGSGRYLFKAPEYSALNAGDEVMVETKNGKKAGKILFVLSATNETDDDYQMAMLCANNENNELKRVLEKIEHREISWE